MRRQGQGWQRLRSAFNVDPRGRGFVSEKLYFLCSRIFIILDAAMTEIHAADRYTLRHQSARVVVLTKDELAEIRAAQRTFEGAYIRTALGLFSFSLVVLKIFTSEFYSIGALFAVYGAGVLFTSLVRRAQGNRQFFSDVGEDGFRRKRFRTSGNVVVLLTALSVAAYICLLGLTMRLQ